MKKSKPNQIVARLQKRYLKLSASYDPTEDNKTYWAEVEQIKTELAAITQVVGAISVMNKNNILRLIALQSSLRFMPEHRFYMQFAKATEDLKLTTL